MMRTDWLSSMSTGLTLTAYGFLSVLQLGVGVVHASSPRVHEVGAAADPLTLLVIGSSFATAALGGLHAWLAHLGKTKRLELELQQIAWAKEVEVRLAAADKRLALIDRGIPCELDNCPVVAIVSGSYDWSKLPPLQHHVAPSVPGPPAKPCQNGKDTPCS